jgi:sulfoxide reductase heme-binding subunit YedZ
VTQQIPAQYAAWLAGRAAGLVALLLVTATVLLGLALAARVVPPRRRAAVLAVHQHLAIVSLGAIAAHVLFLLADPWLKPGIAGVAVPFTLPYRPLWTGTGIVGAYLAAILGLSFYVRRRIGARLWRRMHRFTVAVYGLSLAHALGAGTDTSLPAVRYALLGSIAPVAFLFALRIQRSRVGAPGPRAPVAAPPPGAAAAAARQARARPGREPHRHAAAEAAVADPVAATR